MVVKLKATPRAGGFRLPLICLGWPPALAGPVETWNRCATPLRTPTVLHSAAPASRAPYPGSCVVRHRRVFGMVRAICETLTIAQSRLIEVAGFGKLIPPEQQHLTQVLPRFRIGWIFGNHLLEIGCARLRFASGSFHACQVVARVGEFWIELERLPEELSRFEGF